MHACVCAHVCMCACVHVYMCACVRVYMCLACLCSRVLCFSALQELSASRLNATLQRRQVSRVCPHTHPFYSRCSCVALPSPIQATTSHTHTPSLTRTPKNTHTQTDTHTHSHTHKHTLLRVAWFASQAMSAKAEADEDTMKILGKVLRMSFDDFVLVVLYTHYSTRP